MKRLLSAILCIALLLSCVPAIGAAETEIGGSYTTWDKAAVLSDGQTGSFVLDTYNTSWTANQMWFALNVEEDDQAIKLDFSGIAAAGLQLSAYLYSANTLNTSGPSGSLMTSFGSFSVDNTYYYKVADAGVYYLMLRPSGSNKVSSKVAQVTFSLMDGDENEFNDTREMATELSAYVDRYFNLNAGNDADWFKISIAKPGQSFKLVFSNMRYDYNKIDFYIYEGDSTYYSVDKLNFNVDCEYTYKANTAGDYYVQVKTHYTDVEVNEYIKLRYELVEGDAYEVNDTWQTATSLADNYPTEFSISGVNDVDWFCFETTEELETVSLNFTEFETDYSNRINYTVYQGDAANGGPGTQLVSQSEVRIYHSYALNLTTPGKYYVKVEDYSVGYQTPEKMLTLTLVRGSKENDGFEKNNTWETAALITEGVANQFNLPAKSDVDWFKIEVTDPDVAIQLKFTGFKANSASIEYALYSHDSLYRYGGSASSLDSDPGSYGFNKNLTRTYKITDPGVYYVKVRLYNDHVQDDLLELTYNIVSEDENENNDTYGKATPLEEGISKEFTLHGHNDVDWFAITVPDPDAAISLRFEGFDSNSPAIRYNLYSHADFIRLGTSASALDSDPGSYGFNKNLTRTYKITDPGVYYVKVRLYNDNVLTDPLTIHYDLVQPDRYENNDTYARATMLLEEVAAPFTIHGHNDVDWFQIEVPEDNMTVELRFNGFDADPPTLRYYLYRGSDILTYGNSASALDSDPGSYGFSKNLTRTCKANTAGTYYVKVRLYNANVKDDEMTISYRLLGNDSHEYNDDYDNATPLSPNEIKHYTITAHNDKDIFKIENVTAGDKMSVHLNGFTKNERIYASLYYLDTENLTYKYVKSGDYYKNSKFSYTAAYTGTYYLVLNSDGSNHAFDNDFTVRYTLAQDNTPVSSLRLNHSGETIYAGTTLSCFGITDPFYASVQELTWKSSNEAVATVDANGLVTAAAEGEAIITGTLVDTVGGKTHTATCTITVVPAVRVEGVSLQYENAQNKPRPLAYEGSMKMEATVFPSAATNQNLIWSSSDEDVLCVTSYGKVVAVGSGTACITVTTEDGGYTASCWFNVPDGSYPVKSVSLDLYNATMYMGEDGLQLTATINPTYAANQNVRWTSSDETVATVDKNGFVTQRGEGETYITVTTEEGDFSAKCYISVQPKRVRVTGVSLDEGKTIGLYGNVTLQPIFTPADATDQTVTWTSSNKAIATVSRAGIVTGMSCGQATITVTTNDGGFTASTVITVSANAEMGDLSNDGVVDSADAILILRYDVGLVALSADQKAVADVSGDGIIDVGDAILILRYDAGLIKQFPGKKQ